MSDNPDLEVDALIDGYVAGRLTAEQAHALSERLGADAAARDRFLHAADLHACLSADESLWVAPLAASEPRAARPLGTWARVAASVAFLACGSALGFASATWLRAGTPDGPPPPAWQDLPLVDGGFESGAALGTGGAPAVPGTWGGDYVSVVGAADRVVPLDGLHMLQFLRSDNSRTPAGAETRASQQWQVIDLTPWRQRVAGGHATVELSAAFARAEKVEAYRVGVALHAFNGSLRDLSQRWADYRETREAGADKNDVANRPPGQWQRVATQLLLPADATVLVIEIRASGRSGAAGQPVAFDGCYADAVTLRLRDAQGSR